MCERSCLYLTIRAQLLLSRSKSKKKRECSVRLAPAGSQSKEPCRCLQGNQGSAQLAPPRGRALREGVRCSVTEGWVAV